jgi:hypothetical protein
MNILPIKHHHRNYVLQALGFVGLIAITVITVAVGNSAYRYASILQERRLSETPESYAIFEEKEQESKEPCGDVNLAAALLRHFR